MARSVDRRLSELERRAAPSDPVPAPVLVDLVDVPEAEHQAIIDQAERDHPRAFLVLVTGTSEVQNETI